MLSNPILHAQARRAAYGNDSHVFFSSFVDGFLPSFWQRGSQVVPLPKTTGPVSSTIPEYRGRATDGRTELDQRYALVFT